MNDSTPTPTTPNRILSLAAAGKLAPLGPVSAVSVWRWCTKGCLSRDGQRVRLGCLKIGRKLATTPEMLDEFFRACGNAGGVCS